jgi:hypothetical protein
MGVPNTDGTRQNRADGIQATRPEVDTAESIAHGSRRCLHRSVLPPCRTRRRIHGQSSIGQQGQPGTATQIGE